MIKLSIFLILAAIVYLRADRADPKEIERSCLLETGIENQNRTSLMLRLLSEEDLSYDEKCFFKCFNERAQMMDDEGNFTPREGISFVATHAEAEFSESDVDTVVSRMDYCGYSEVEDHCERAANISNCFYRVLQ